MMYFPELYPDELLVSAIARFHVHIMSPTFNATKEQLFGKCHIHPNLELPCSLRAFQKNTFHLLNLTAAEIAWSHTMLPYYTAYKDESTKERALVIMVDGGRSSSPITILGAQLQPSPAPAYMRTCPNCIAEDMAAEGETYWRRSHQLRTVHFCIRHKCPLMSSPYPYISSSHRFVAAHPEMLLSNYLPNLSKSETKKLLRISKILCSCLARNKHDSAFVKLPNFKEILANSKYMRGRTADVKSFVEHFNVFFGATVLELLGMSADPGRKDNWVRAVLYRAISVSPIKVALLKLFCETLDSEEPTRARPGPWLCQNPLAEHHGTPALTRCTMTKTGRRRFECTCGFAFTSALDSWTTDGQPIRQRTVQISPRDAELIRLAHHHGKSQHQLARWLKVSNTVIHKIINETASTRRQDPHFARQALANKRQRAKSSLGLKNGHADSWVSKDKEAQARILQAVREIKELEPPKRVTVGALSRKTGLTVFRSGKAAPKLPLTTACITENLESRDDCRVRAVIWHFENWPAHQKLSRTLLCKLASVTFKNPSAMAMVATLLSAGPKPCD